MRTLFVLLLGLYLSQSTAPQEMAPDITHGNGLLRACSDDAPSGLNHAFCMGYLEGAREGLSMLEKGKSTGAYFCEPENATLLQVRDIVVKYLRDNPENRQEVSILLVYRAFHKAWPGPCS
jgi:Rap1a immunity proteins